MKRRDFLKIATGSAGGAAAVGAVGARSSSASAVLQEGDGNNTTSGNGTTGAAGNGTAGNGTQSGGGGLPGAGTTKTVEVGPNNTNTFAPETVYIRPGATVKWVWKSPGHNVHAQKVPDGASWDVQTKITETADFTYSYTFDGPKGEYTYQCDPHAGMGMVGTVVVNDSGEAPGGGGGGESSLSPHEMGVAFQAHYVGIATILMLLVSLVYTFFVVKYGESQHASAPNKR
ncbi:plastocyanin/azurin family copper-binding protein [Halobacterium zhouii]|uniref:plastocyanin/azurin family copper-binding protein n=1 Tax=Halobacterium zhouii TaxID=2902624 RepID=UPI001E57A326|nr:plastocyanin/azurin family copper-binding protein [Halobacterium zhouii]